MRKIIVLIVLSIGLASVINAKEKVMKKENKTYPKTFSHIGITIPDLDKAVEFYTEVMGVYVIMPPTEVVEENETAIGQM